MIGTRKTYLTLALVGGVLALGSALWLWFPIPAEPYLPEPIANASGNATSSIPIIPAGIRISSIAVAAEVVSVGTDSEGRMAVPGNFDDVGWWEHGALPGVEGRAVLAGHVDDARGHDAVFARLDELSPGDEIEVIGIDGRSLRFTVSDTAVYPYDAAPRERIFGASNEKELVLITCDGTWNQAERTYSDRLVVYAELTEG